MILLSFRVGRISSFASITRRVRSGGFWETRPRSGSNFLPWRSLRSISGRKVYLRSVNMPFPSPYDQHLLLFDNGFNSLFQMPPGINRGYASPRKYRVELDANLATEVWNYELDQSILSPICSSVYEDAPLNYVIDYAFVGGFQATTPYAQLLGLDASGEKVFYYQYSTIFCDTAFNTIPLHLERTSFPTIESRSLNISTRGVVGTDEESLIGGFIISGTDSETVVLRALGPSLSASGPSQTVADPTFTLYDASGAMIATNDDWESDPGASQSQRMDSPRAIQPKPRRFRPWRRERTLLLSPVRILPRALAWWRLMIFRRWQTPGWQI